METSSDKRRQFLLDLVQESANAEAAQAAGDASTLSNADVSLCLTAAQWALLEGPCVSSWHHSQLPDFGA